MGAVLRVCAAVKFLRVLISPEGGRVQHQHGVGRAGEHQLRGVAALGPVQGTWGVKYFYRNKMIIFSLIQSWNC